MQSSVVGAKEQIDAQLRHLATLAFGAGAGEHLVSALRKALSSAESRRALDSRAEAQRRANFEGDFKRADFEYMQLERKRAAEERGPAATETPMPFEQDEQLDLLAFSSLVRAREGIEIDNGLIKKIFAAFDADGSGTISAHEYLMYSLSEAFSATELRAIDLFKQWDEDGSGAISEKEFVKATTVLGYAVPTAVATKLFRTLDVDRSGTLAYKELGKVLTKNVGGAATKAELLRYTPGGQQANRDSRSGKVTARDSTNYASVRTRALPAGAQLDASSAVPVMQQLGALLTAHSQTIVRLFQDWDEDGNGAISQSEFRRALQGLGYTVDRSIFDELFNALQGDNTGKHDMADFIEIEY